MDLVLVGQSQLQLSQQHTHSSFGTLVVEHLQCWHEHSHISTDDL